MHAASAGRPMSMRSGEVARGESIVVGLFVDGVPESIALGLSVAEGEVGVALLAGIVVGNLVEAYGAAQPIVAGGRTPVRRGAARPDRPDARARHGGGRDGPGGREPRADRHGAGDGRWRGAAVVAIAIIPHAFDEVSSLVAIATVGGFVGGYLLS